MKISSCLLVCCLILGGSEKLFAQPTPQPLDRVLMNLPDSRGHDALSVDRGSAGLWHRLLKLQTTASVMHTTAHPDDEHAGLLTYLSRDLGTRTALLTINRGEGGANAIGSELFDALGMIRTEELRTSARYYGLDDQYFTTFTDYGYSKTLDEALTNWGRENVLEEMVRIIRINRPWVVISRFHGSERDGHGHHQAAGGITPEAVEAAGDPSRFPDQITGEGLRPWNPFKVFRGGVNEREDWTVKVDVGAYNPWIGDSYQNFGYYGLSLQRSQTGGRSRDRLGSSYRYYERLDAVESGSSQIGFFTDIDTSISGIAKWVDGDLPAGAQDLLNDIQRQVEAAVSVFRGDNPQAVTDMLVGALKDIRSVRELLSSHYEANFLLEVKGKQIEDAIHAALGLQVNALAMLEPPAANPSPWAPLPTMGAVVPGQKFFVSVDVLNPGEKEIRLEGIYFDSQAEFSTLAENYLMEHVSGNTPYSKVFEVRLSPEASASTTYFTRESISKNRYTVDDQSALYTARGAPPLEVVVRYLIGEEVLEYREIVRTREANLPYGYELQPLKIAPRIAVNASPTTRVVPLGAQPAVFDVNVEVWNNDPAGAAGELRLQLPEGWTALPEAHPFDLQQPGQGSSFSVRVTAQGLEAGVYIVKAQGIVDGKIYERGYETVDQSGLERHYIDRPALLEVHGMEVQGLTGMDIGYVMGVGDEVPSGIGQLGAEVTLLSEQDLAGADLAAYDAIVVGTRAYAVRPDLLTHHNRLMDYIEAGGHLVVLYQTPEYVPDRMAPYPADLPRNAEEVSEEDALITILQPDHEVFKRPNTITPADFEGWIEQRGSKFFASWDPAYIPLVSSHDTGQDPQEGGWMMADFGEGTFTYFAYAIHRQLPFAVPGAYRIFANVLGHRLDIGH